MPPIPCLYLFTITGLLISIYLNNFLSHLFTTSSHPFSTTLHAKMTVLLTTSSEAPRCYLEISLSVSKGGLEKLLS